MMTDDERIFKARAVLAFVNGLVDNDYDRVTALCDALASIMAEAAQGYGDRLREALYLVQTMIADSAETIFGVLAVAKECEQ